MAHTRTLSVTNLRWVRINDSLPVQQAFAALYSYWLAKRTQRKASGEALSFVVSACTTGIMDEMDEMDTMDKANQNGLWSKLI